MGFQLKIGIVSGKVEFVSYGLVVEYRNCCFKQKVICRIFSIQKMVGRVRIGFRKDFQKSYRELVSIGNGFCYIQEVED